MKGCSSIKELNDLPVRYTQAIFKQYHIFSQSQEAQQAAASEDMMEELEDGAMGFGGAETGSGNKTAPVNLNIRAEQIKKIRESIQASHSTDPEQIYLNNMASKAKSEESSNK